MSTRKSSSPGHRSSHAGGQRHRPAKPRQGGPGTRIVAADAGCTLAEWLERRLGTSKRQVKALLDRKQVRVNGQAVWMGKHRLRPGDVVQFPPLRKEAPPPAAPETDSRVYHRDADLLVVEKPAGLVSESHRNSLEARLRREFGEPELRALHRLDKGTSGLFLLTRRSEHRNAFVDLFRSKEIEKIYLALVRGALPEEELCLDTPLDHREAVSYFRAITSAPPYQRVECRILTGRTHQIRRHLPRLGAQLVGDREYGASRNLPAWELAEPWPLLHAHRLRFVHPVSGEELSLCSPEPPRFRNVAEQTGLR